MITIDNKVYNISMETLLDTLKLDITNGKLSSYKRTSSGINIPCPVHSNGLENHPSCFISDEGVWHCFTCGSKGYVDSLIAECLDISKEEAKEWLASKFNYNLLEDNLDLLPIDLDTKQTTNKLDESILKTFQSFHPYMIKRKLSGDICHKFSIKYDEKSESLVFPVWDEKDNLVFLTRRCVNNKKFFIPPDVQKPVYLLNFIEKEGIKDVIVCESQINALYSWSLGHPAIALFGTGTDYQYSILNKSGIRHYTLAFDGDGAGKRGAERFMKHIRNDVFVDKLNIPKGKDLNDLTEEEINKLLGVLNCDFYI